MSVRIVKDYYIRRKKKLIEDFGKHIKGVRLLFAEKFDDAKLKQILINMKTEFENLIPEIPYIGGKKNPNTLFLIKGISNLAIFRILEKEGLTYRQIGEFYYEFIDGFNRIRKKRLEKIGKNPALYPFETEYVNYIKDFAETSQKRNYPDDFVFNYVEGDGNSFEWGIDYSECGLVKLFKKLGATKFMPLLCLSDFSEANIFGYGFSRTQDLGHGAPMCDHRFIKNSKTPRAWPPENLPEN